MTGALFPEITIDSPLEQTNLVLMAILGNLSGSDNFGVPQNEITGDYVDGGGVDSRWFRDYASTETTLGQLSRWTVNGQTAMQYDNNGASGVMPLDIANTGHFSGTVTMDVDAIIGRDASVGRNLAVANDAAISGDLAVTLTSTLTGNVGIGAAPDATVKAKITGGAWITGDVGIKVTPSGDFGLEIADDIGPSTDNARDLGSSSKQWRNIYTEGLTVDSPTMVADPSNHRMGFGTASPAYPNHFEGNTAFDVNTSVPTLFVDDTNHKVGVLTASPLAGLDINARMRVTADTPTPTTGAGLEFAYSSGSTIGIIRCGTDLSGAPSYQAIRINGLNVQLYGAGVEKFRANAAGVMFYATGSGAAQVTGTGIAAGAADATYGNTERDMINHMWGWFLSAGIATT